MNREEFINYVYSTIPENYTIGIHGISGRSDNFKKLNGILKNGLNNHGWGGMLSNIQMFGQVKNLTEESWRKILDYYYCCDDNSKVVNIYFAFPETITDYSSVEYYLGYYPYIGRRSPRSRRR